MRKRGARARLAAAALAAAVGAVAMAGCSSGPPAYCSDRTTLENSVKGLGHPDLSNGISSLKAQLQKVESDASALVASAKNDFPSQTSAITSSVDALKGAVTQLSSGLSAANLAAVATDAASVVSSVRSFMDATNSKCGSS
jgi:hypothetical protein